MREEELPPLHRHEGRLGCKTRGYIATSFGEGFLQLSNNGIILKLGVMKGPEQGYDGPRHEAVRMHQGSETPFQGSALLE